MNGSAAASGNGMPSGDEEAAESQVLVLDIGGNVLRFGFANSAEPRVSPNPHKGLIEHGVVTNWEAMEKVWHAAFFSDLRSDPKDHPVLMTEAPLNPKVNRERMVQLAFDTFGVPALHIAIEAVLSLYKSGRQTGIVVSSGFDASWAVPVQKGFALPHAVMRMPLAGKDLTEYMTTLLMVRGDITPDDREAVQGLKEKLSYVALDFDAQVKAAKGSHDLERHYKLPRGEVIRLGSECIRCPEVLFKPAFMGKKVSGLHDITCQAISLCDMDIRNELCMNVVLAGGNTMFQGMAERMKKELSALAHLEFNVVAPEEHSAWYGGAMTAKEPSFRSRCVSKAEYEESGPAVVHRKCS